MMQDLNKLDNAFFSSCIVKYHSNWTDKRVDMLKIHNETLDKLKSYTEQIDR